MTSSRFHVRAGAAGLAAVWVMPALLSVLHSAHAHRYCAEHQAIEEADEGPQASAAVAPAQTHQACAFVAAQQKGHCLSARIRAPNGAAGHAPVATPTALTAERQIALLAFAPKASHAGPARSASAPRTNPVLSPST